LKLAQQGGAPLNQVGYDRPLFLGRRPSIKEVTLPTWIAESLLIVLSVDINQWSHLCRKAANRHQFVI
jgi:hypothetical protein